MNESSAIKIVLVAVTALTPLAAFVYWFATTYVTRKQLQEELDEVCEKLKAIEARVTTAENLLVDGRLQFLDIGKDVKSLLREIHEIKARLDKLGPQPIMHPNCQIASEIPGDRQ